MTDKFTVYLPFLRRFARVLVGSQRGGDVLVLTTLQQLATNTADLGDCPDLRTGLYRALLRIWQSPVGHHILGLGASSGLAPSHAGAVDLRDLRALSRVVFLLTHLEEFPRPMAMAILEVDDSTFDMIDMIADEEVNYLLATDVMIIEDELLIAHELETIMVTLGHTVTTVVRTAKQAIKAAAKRVPRLILSDVQLADGSSGIDAVTAILKSITVPTIFITAFPERLLTGLKSEPTYLVTKPFRIEQIKAVVCQALFFDTGLRWKLSGPELSEALMCEWPNG